MGVKQNLVAGQQAIDSFVIIRRALVPSLNILTLLKENCLFSSPNLAGTKIRCYWKEVPNFLAKYRFISAFYGPIDMLFEVDFAAAMMRKSHFKKHLFRLRN